MAGNIHIHPAPGLSGLMPGWWAYPNDPAALLNRVYDCAYRHRCPCW